MVRNPSILLLDEATSALDPRAEAAVAATLERIGQGAQRSPYRIAWRASPVPIVLSCLTLGGWWNRARTPNCSTMLDCTPPSGMNR
jgi:hypothetical protein